MNDYRCIPLKEDAEFATCMKDVLNVYELPYNPIRSDNNQSFLSAKRITLYSILRINFCF